MKAIQAGVGVGGRGLHCPLASGVLSFYGNGIFLKICWWGYGESKTPVHCTPGRNVKWCNCCGKKIIPQKKKKQTELSYDYPGIPLWAMWGHPKESTGNQHQGLQQMFVHHVHSSIIHNGQKNRNEPISTMDERINKMWSIHTMEYYSAMRVDILKHATIGINLEDILLSELRQYKGTNRGPLMWDAQSNHSLPGDSVVYNLPAMQEMWVPPLGQEDPRRRKCQPAPVFLPGKSHGQRSLAGCSPRGPKRVGHDLAIKTNKGSSNSYR